MCFWSAKREMKRDGQGTICITGQKLTAVRVYATYGVNLDPVINEKYQQS
jgi:hypothetical protein